MYVCICRQITNKQVEEILQKNPNIPTSEVLKKLGLGSDCGTCVEDFLATQQIKDVSKVTKNKGLSSKFSLPQK